MVEMTRSAPVSALAPEFDDFLFASIGEGGNGMLLSVVSALARLDLDPWQEAAELARLSAAAATRRLASLIAALPDWPSAHPDFATIAARLVALLPHQVGFSTSSTGQSAGVRIRAVIRSRPFHYVLFIVMFCVLGSLGIIASRPSVARVRSADARVSGTLIPPALPSSRTGP